MVVLCTGPLFNKIWRVSKMQIGSKIYYLKSNGNILVNTGECQGDVRETSVDEDFKMYTALQGLAQSSVGVIRLDYGQLTDKFMSCTGSYVDITKNPIDANAIVFDFSVSNAAMPHLKREVYQEQNNSIEGAEQDLHENQNSYNNDSIVQKCKKVVSNWISKYKSGLSR